MTISEPSRIAFETDEGGAISVTDEGAALSAIVNLPV